MRVIDHIVYTVPDLDAAITDLETRLGVRPVVGGRHDTQGTKNALVNLSAGAYLEILAADDDNLNIPPPRWMGVDVLTRPRVTRWALKSDDLSTDAAILSAYHPDFGRTSAGSRQRPDGGTLRWSLVLPTALPEVAVLPFMVDWSASDVHPHDALPATGCSLIEIQLRHPDPESIRPVLRALGTSVSVSEGERADLKVLLRCPAGEIVL